SIEQALSEEFQLPIVVWGLRRNITLRHLLGEKTLVCVSITSVLTEEEPIFDVLIDGLFGLPYVPILFMYKRLGNAVPSVEQLKILFAWCWQNRFINVFLTHQHGRSRNRSGLDLYTYTPFPEVTIKNLSQSGYQHKDVLLDLRGHEFRVPVFQDPLNVFQRSNGRLSGAFGYMFASYVRHRRGRLRLELAVDVDRYNYHEHLMLAASRGEIEVGVHPYSTMLPGSSLTEGSFPVGLTNSCVLVPWQRESPPGRFIRIAARVNGCFFVVLLLAMTLTWHLAAGSSERGIQLSLAAFYQQSLPDREFHRLTEPYKCIHVAVLLGAFILWTMSTANLSSVFTSQNQGSQIQNVDDFLATPLRLMVTHSEVETYFDAGLLPSGLKPRLLVVNRSTLAEHLNRLNTSYAYCITTEHWEVVSMQQRRLHRPRFRVATDICTSIHFLRFPIQRNSPFRRNLYRFLTHSRQHGISSYWTLRSSLDAIHAGLVVELTDDNQSFQSLNLKDLQLLLKIYFASLLGCSLCLLGEIAWKYYRDVKDTK
ncbi:hypothetical protein KR009_012209, partial [Drosophila setifemur]